MFILQKTDVKAKKGRNIDSQDHLAKETQRQTLNKAILEGFLSQRGLALCCQRQGEL
jgi:hypothetical protein